MREKKIEKIGLIIIKQKKKSSYFNCWFFLLEFQEQIQTIKQPKTWRRVYKFMNINSIFSRKKDNENLNNVNVSHE